MLRVYSVSCGNAYYKGGVAWAVVAVIVYPIGVPMMYLWLLHSHKHEIMNRNKPKPTPPSISNDTNDETANESSVTEIANPIANVVIAKAPTVAAPIVGLSQEALRLEFLFKSYKPEYWYWEVVETYRRLMLTAVLSVIATGSGSQVVASMSISMVYIKIYGYYQPYAVGDKNTLAEIGQIQILLTFFGAIIIFYSVLGKFNML